MNVVKGIGLNVCMVLKLHTYWVLISFLLLVFESSSWGSCKPWNNITTNNDITTNNELSNYSIELSVQTGVSTRPP